MMLLDRFSSGISKVFRYEPKLIGYELLHTYLKLIGCELIGYELKLIRHKPELLSAELLNAQLLRAELLNMD